jgi:hypothetical protein
VIHLGAFHRFTAIDKDHPASMPPLRELLLLYCAITHARGWHTFRDPAHRVAILNRYGYTHWRELMTVDSP